MHLALHDFVGEWEVSQKIWSTPDANPITNRGKTRCTKLLDGLATLMITEMDTSDFRGVALITYNLDHSRFELAFLDTFSTEGIFLMEGQLNRAPSHAALRAEFGATATQERAWQTAAVSDSQCLPGDVISNVSQFAAAAAPAAVAPAAGTAVAAQVSLRLVENKVSDDRWVLEFYAPGPGGKEFLVQQNTFTRVR